MKPVNRSWDARGAALLVLLTMAGPARAGTDSGERFVVIVGNNGSVDAEVEPLQYADDDAVGFARLLRPYATRIELLTVLDDATQRRYAGVAGQAVVPTRAGLRAALERVYDAVRRSRARSTELIFIYVGHGSLDREGKGYVHLADARFTRADLFHDVVSASPADVTHIILDACNAYSLIVGRGDGDGDRARLDALFERFLAGHDLSDYPSVGVLAATSESRETHEWSRIEGGIFSHQVRSALTGAADINGDGRLEYSEVAAFVDAANAELPAAGKRIATFVWPPARDRRRPLLQLREAEGLRRIDLGGEVRGRLHLESTGGERWATFHVAAGHAVQVRVPADRDFFVRDDAHEQEIAAGSDDVVVDTLPEVPYSVARRGAVDLAFERGLFAIPFSRAYYRGFLSGRSQLIGVELDSPAREVEAPGIGWRWVAGYGGGPAALARERWAHGAFVRVALPVGPTWSLVPGVEATRVALANGNALTAAWLLAEFELRRLWSGGVALQGGFGLGYGVSAVTGNVNSGDASVGIARARMGVELQLVGSLWLHAGGAYALHLVTVDGQDVVRTAPQAYVGAAWH